MIADLICKHCGARFAWYWYALMLPPVAFIGIVGAGYVINTIVEMGGG